MKWNIVADSSCDLFELEKQYENIRFSSVPFVISIGTSDFVDNEKLDIDQMVAVMENSTSSSYTSCPTPYDWYKQFENSEKTIAVTISSKLSGSYNSAKAAMDMILDKYPEKKIALIDSKSTGPELVLIIRKICEFIETGNDYEHVVRKAVEFADHTHIVFALSSFNHLINNGRISRIVGFIAGKLHLWGIGIGDEEGSICIRNKVRGRRMVIDAIIADMKERGSELSEVVISHCQNVELAETLKTSIQNLWHNISVKVIQSRGLCSYYAERGGLIVAY